MQAVVKTPRIEISVKGTAILPRLMEVLKEEYGLELSLVEDDGDDLVDAFAIGLCLGLNNDRPSTEHQPMPSKHKSGSLSVYTCLWLS
jgi:hypothetical protein